MPLSWPASHAGPPLSSHAREGVVLGPVPLSHLEVHSGERVAVRAALGLKGFSSGRGKRTVSWCPFQRDSETTEEEGPRPSLRTQSACCVGRRVVIIELDAHASTGQISKQSRAEGRAQERTKRCQIASGDGLRSAAAVCGQSPELGRPGLWMRWHRGRALGEISRSWSGCLPSVSSRTDFTNQAPHRVSGAHSFAAGQAINPQRTVARRRDAAATAGLPARLPSLLGWRLHRGLPRNLYPRMDS